MKLLLLAAFGLLCLSSINASDTFTEFVTGYNTFTSNVYKEILKSNPTNLILCPLSANIALTLVNSGARGQTSKEITTALHLPEDPQKMQEIFATLVPNLQSSDAYNLSGANYMYIKDGIEINEHFKSVAVNFFDADILNIDFTKTEDAVHEINKVVEEKTGGKIKNLVDSNMINDNTVALILNAMYFGGRWVTEFDSNATTTHSFFVHEKEEVLTSMMFALNRYEYYECSKLNAKFLKLDYVGGSISMHIVLPKDIEGLAALEKNILDVLNPPDYEFKKVHVMIPKMQIETRIMFKPLLEALGIRSAFGSADFSGILASKKDVQISEMAQKTFIEVHEKGTTAASATGIVYTSRFGGGSPAEEPEQFHADHPFLFYVRLNKVGINLFVGRYTSP